MKFYQELTLLPMAEIGLNFLWKKLFKRVHLALVSLKDEKDLIPVGVSFPEFDEANNTLGTKLRLFAPTDKVLKNLKIEEKLLPFKDYLHITSIHSVPENLIKSYAIFSRWRKGKQNIERLARRRVKRHNVTFEEALSYYSKMNVSDSKTPPFIVTKSFSHNTNFRLFIDMKAVEKPGNNMYTCYGLSTSERTEPSTVPIF